MKPYQVFVCLMVGMVSLVTLRLYGERTVDAQTTEPVYRSTLTASDVALGMGADGDKVSRYRPVLSMAHVPDPQGSVTGYINSAAYAWHAGTVDPWRPDGAIEAGRRVLKWPMIVEQLNGTYAIMWFGKVKPDDPAEEGRFRSSNWSHWSTPKRWAYVRLAEEVFNPVTKQFDIPGLGPEVVPPVPPVSDPSKPLPKSLRYGVDSLKIRYTTGDILRAIDESVYNEPSEGAPEEGGAAPL